MKEIQYTITVLSAVVLTWLLHESAHWLTGELLGNTMVMTLNACYPANGQFVHPWQATVVSAAGPFVTVLEGFILFRVLIKNGAKMWMPFLLTCLYMRFLAGVMNVINPNDEGRISLTLGIGKYTLSGAVVALLGYWVYDVVRKKGYTRKFITITLLLIMLFSSAVILADQALKIKIL